MKRRYFYYEGMKLSAYRTTYVNNGRLAIVLLMKDPEDPVWGIVTVNIDDGIKLEENYAYLDTNNCPRIDIAIFEAGIGVPTGMYGMSGYCRYPLYKFDLSKIPEVKL